jgi:hypothetical protein
VEKDERHGTFHDTLGPTNGPTKGGKNMRTIWTVAAALAATLTLAGVAFAGPVAKTKDAVDPDCTVGKAVKGAAERAAVGVGNRCKPGETARDVVGIDNKKKSGKNDGPLKNRDGD